MNEFKASQANLPTKVLSVAALTLVIVSFQNCGQKTSFSNADSSSLGESALPKNPSATPNPITPIATPVVSPVVIPVVTPIPVTQSLPPTDNCYFWVSGIFPSDTNDLSTYQSRIGDVSLSWLLAGPNNPTIIGGEEASGAGTFPNNYISFPRSVTGTWDGAAIPAGVHLQVWSKVNFQGTLLIDVHGPKLLYSDSNAVSFNKVFSDAALQSQYPQSTRMRVSFPGLTLDANGNKLAGSSKVGCE